VRTEGSTTRGATRRRRNQTLKADRKIEERKMKPRPIFLSLIFLSLRLPAAPLPLSNHPRLTTAPASWTHSKRCARQFIQPAGTCLKRFLATDSRGYPAWCLQQVKRTGRCNRRPKAGWKDDNLVNTSAKRRTARSPACSAGRNTGVPCAPSAPPAAAPGATPPPNARPRQGVE
jgi:hypothetical protein